MTDTDAIRDAIGVIADGAHPPQRIRAALDGRLRHHHQRRLLLRVAGATATAAAVGAGGVGVYRLSRRDDPEFPGIAGGPGGGWLRAEPRWYPAWLPDGFGLTELGAVIDGDQAAVASRSWTPPPRADGPTTSMVSLTTGWSDTYAPQLARARTEHVDVHGVPGELVTFADGGTWLSWQPPGEPKLTLSTGLSDAERERAVALRVARSLRRDPRTIQVGPRPGWLPARFGAPPWLFTLDSRDGAWVQNVIVRAAAEDVSASFGPGVGLGFDRAGAQPAKVGGMDAWLGPQGVDLFLLLPDGSGALVTAAVPAAELVRIAEDFDFGPAPDMTWYGSR